jgi:hypothetical protein
VGSGVRRDVVGSGGAARWGVETVEQRRDAVGSGVPTRHGGEWRRWSGSAARWGVECGRDAVGSGDGGVRRDSMGSGVLALAR